MSSVRQKFIQRSTERHKFDKKLFRDRLKGTSSTPRSTQSKKLTHPFRFYFLDLRYNELSRKHFSHLEPPGRTGRNPGTLYRFSKSSRGHYIAFQSRTSRLRWILPTLIRPNGIKARPSVHFFRPSAPLRSTKRSFFRQTIHSVRPKEHTIRFMRRTSGHFLFSIKKIGLRLKFVSK